MKILRFLVCLAMPATAFAQGYSIDWFKVAGGGEASAGANYSVTGTVGQATAGGVVGGGNYSMVGGFWGLIAGAPSPEGTLLTILRSNEGVRVLWPSSLIGFSLQQTSNLMTDEWTDFLGLPSDDGMTKSFTIPTFAGSKFFRLFNLPR